MRNKWAAIFFMVIMATSIFSCNQHSTLEIGSFANGPFSNGPASNSNIHFMDQQASDEGTFPVQVITEGPSVGPVNIPDPATINVNVLSEDKGIGKFTNISLTALNEAMAADGEQLFEANCAGCHSATDERIVGPGLKGVTTIRTPEWIMNMITNSAGMTSEDPIGKALLQKYAVQMAVSVTNDQARKILEYLRENDGTK